MVIASTKFYSNPCLHGSSGADPEIFDRGPTFLKFLKSQKKGGEKTNEKGGLWWFFPFLQMYGLNRLNRLSRLGACFFFVQLQSSL